jgi:hypothetical protein
MYKPATMLKYTYLSITIVFYSIATVALILGVGKGGGLLLIVGAAIHFAISMTVVDSLVSMILAHPVGTLPEDDPIWKSSRRKKC